MATRLIVLVVLALLAAGIAYLLQRRRPDPPSAPSYRAPAQLDRADFDGADRPYLAVLFASTTCNTCPEVWEMVGALDLPQLATQRIDVQDRADLHKRYRIDGVPTTLFADSDGVVTTAYFGPFDAEQLRDALIQVGGGQ